MESVRESDHELHQSTSDSDHNLSLSLRPGAAGASHSVRPPPDEEEEVSFDPAHAARQWHM